MDKEKGSVLAAHSYPEITFSSQVFALFFFSVQITIRLKWHLVYLWWLFLDISVKECLLFLFFINYRAETSVIFALNYNISNFSPIGICGWIIWRIFLWKIYKYHLHLSTYSENHYMVWTIYKFRIVTLIVFKINVVKNES